MSTDVWGQEAWVHGWSPVLRASQVKEQVASCTAAQDSPSAFVLSTGTCGRVKGGGPPDAIWYVQQPSSCLLPRTSLAQADRLHLTVKP